MITREPRQDATVEALRRRLVYVRGEHDLWIDMADWELRESSKRIFHSEQSRHQLRKAGRRLQGQVLTRLSIGMRPLRTTFFFDHGSELRVVRYKRANAEWELWHLFTRRSVLELLSSGQLRHFSPKAKGGRLHGARGVDVAV